MKTARAPVWINKKLRQWAAGRSPHDEDQHGTLPAAGTGLTADPVTLARWAAQPDIDAQRPHTSLDLAQTGKVGFFHLFLKFCVRRSGPGRRGLDSLEFLTTPRALRALAIHDRGAQRAANTALRNVSSSNLRSSFEDR